MKTFTTLFNSEKNKTTSISPVWILKCPFTSGTIYLADQPLTITGWDSSPTTKTWIYNWGAIDEDIIGDVSSTRVSDMSISVINDANDSNNFESILNNSSNNIETTDCELYLWFDGLDASADPPVKMWTGNMVDWVKQDELIYSVEMVDMGVRLNKYVGTHVTKINYPDTDADDVNELQPIVYGSVNRVPALNIVSGTMTTLTANVSSAATSFAIGDGTGLANASVIQIDSEQILINGISGSQITACTRGYASTTAVEHLQGATTWEKLSTFVYMVAGHPVQSIGNIYALIGDNELDITATCAKATGQTGNVLAGYEGKAVITTTARPSLTTTSSSLAIQDDVTIIDDIVVADLVTVTENITVTNPAHSHSYTYDRQQFPTNTFPISFTDDGSDTITFNDPGGTKDWANYTFYFTASGNFLTDTGGYVRAMIGNTVVYYRGHSSAFYGTTPITLPSPFTISDESPGNTFGLSLVTAQDAYGSFAIQSCERNVGIIVTTVDATQASTKTTGTTVTKNNAVVRAPANVTAQTQGVFKSGTVSLTGNSAANMDVGDRVLVNVEGYQDDSLGTYTGTANALITRPDHVIKHLLNNYGNVAISSFSTDAASNMASEGYTFNGVIDRYAKLKEWLGLMSFQCRCYFRFYAGTAYLLWRASTGSSDKTITSNMIRMQDNSKTSTRITRSRLDEIVNRINLSYDRDWTKDPSPESYKNNTIRTDSTSITKYGQKERPDLFRFDFVTSGAMANSVSDFYLSVLKDRKSLISATVFLDNSELEFADWVTFEPTSQLAEVQKVNLIPGSGRDNRNDSINLVLKA